VLGCGPDIIYPRESAEIYQKIATRNKKRGWSLSLMINQAEESGGIHESVVGLSVPS